MARALACACLAVCLVCGSDPDTRAVHEQQLLLRMLTLQERAIAADTPLPLTAASLLNVSGGDGSCASGGGAGGLATSLAAIHFARTATRPALPQSSEAVAFDAAFVSVARTFEAARWQGAQAELYAVCVRAHSVSQSFSQRAHAQHAESAALLSGWARSCASLSQYVPSAQPVGEDHKRLLMLLHELGAELLHAPLLGHLLPEPLVSIASLNELAKMVAKAHDKREKAQRKLTDEQRKLTDEPMHFPHASPDPMCAPHSFTASLSSLHPTVRRA